MEPFAASIAAAAGRVLVQAMVTESWPVLRDRLARLMSRRAEDREAQMTSALEDTRHVVLSGSSSSEVAAIRWQGRLEALIEDDPSAVEELQSIVDSSADPSVYRPISVVNGSTAGWTQIVQHNLGGGTIQVSHASARPSP
ncbi:hypothetical protein [Streptomyces sp. NBC_00236]|uniref:hypothetical protein n=1 Tax=unclassified Streptomyces TaxID=2593676 RepID=UPI002E2C36E0|nr:hypothetical protein [Streptomyces sp. NBC_00236]